MNKLAIVRDNIKVGHFEKALCKADEIETTCDLSPSEHLDSGTVTWGMERSNLPRS